MRTRLGALIGLTSVALLTLTACATPEQWAAWKSHKSHFASGQHASFSFRNQGEMAERVKATDPKMARSESWWGRELPMASVQEAGR